MESLPGGSLLVVRANPAGRGPHASRILAAELDLVLDKLLRAAGLGALSR